MSMTLYQLFAHVFSMPTVSRRTGQARLKGTTLAPLLILAVSPIAAYAVQVGGANCHASVPSSRLASCASAWSVASSALDDAWDDETSFVQMGQSVVSTSSSNGTSAPETSFVQMGQAVVSNSSLNGTSAPKVAFVQTGHILRQSLALSRSSSSQVLAVADMEPFGWGLTPKPIARGHRRNSTIVNFLTKQLRATLGDPVVDIVWPFGTDEDASVEKQTRGAVFLFSAGLFLVPLGTFLIMKQLALNRFLDSVPAEEQTRYLCALAVMVLIGCSRGLVTGFTDTVIVVAEYYWDVSMTLVSCLQALSALLFLLALPLWLHASDYHNTRITALMVLGTLGTFYFNGLLATANNLPEALLFKSCAAIFEPALVVAQTRFCFDNIGGSLARGFMLAGFVCEYICHSLFSTFALYYLEVELDAMWTGGTTEGWRWALAVTAGVAALWTLGTLVLMRWAQRHAAGVDEDAPPLWETAFSVLRTAGDAGGTASLWLLGFCGVMASMINSISIYRTVWLTYLGFDTREITFVRFCGLFSAALGYLLGRALGKRNFASRGLRGRVEVAAVSDLCALVAAGMFYLVVPYYSGFFTGVYDGLKTEDVVAYTTVRIIAGFLGTWFDSALTDPMTAQILDASDPKATPAGMAAMAVLMSCIGQILGPLMTGGLMDYNGYMPSDAGVGGRLAYGWNAVCFEAGCATTDMMALFGLIVAHAWIHGRLCGGTSSRPAWLKDPFPTGGE